LEEIILSILTTLGIIGLGTIVGTSAFLFRRRAKDQFRQEEQKEVVTFSLRGLQDVDSICEIVSKGNVVILGVKDLARLDMIRLKRSIQQLKSFTSINGGDLVALGKDFVVVIPPQMKLSLIQRMLQEGMDAENEIEPPELPTEVGTL
jgi:SepF-like predicted cell division protein (DUF552 family)